ncbi:hypothetical protein SAMN05660477_02855 [Soonwooa buanensis]|uniref:DUF4870 domain-containing protein n=1 Tax=Soonwooa buanensis TaxID=619805 RepID=A0A1T5GHY9_9FLAO|nr:import component protein [Soonwooa buanensis]SKC08009.1 hypothetical protein SAMN05660477_02855 [Soonwooa buanensis]
MDNKTLAIISYIPLIGWLIAFFIGRDNADNFLKFHLKQSLALVIFGILFNVAFFIIVMIVPSLTFLGYIGYVVWALVVIGIINAAIKRKIQVQK